MESTIANIGRPRSATPIDAAYRLAFRIGFRAARVWWSVRRPRHEGVQAVIWVGDQLLLLRSSYRHAWGFPGGGVHRGETPEQALRRELVEEIEFRPGSLTPAGTAAGIWDGRRDRVTYFELRLAQPPAVAFDNREITGARLFRVSELKEVPVTEPVRAHMEGRMVFG